MDINVTVIPLEHAPQPGARVTALAFITVGVNEKGYQTQRACAFCTLRLEEMGMVRRVEEIELPVSAPFTALMVRFDLVPPYTLAHCEAMISHRHEGHSGDQCGPVTRQ